MTIEEATYAERQAIDAIGAYDEARKAESTAKATKDAAGQIIRDWMEKHDEHELDDLERGLRALLTSRRLGSDNYDLRSVSPKTLKALAAAGCLVVDTKALDLKANAALRMDLQPLRIPAGETTYLRVVRTDE